MAAHNALNPNSGIEHIFRPQIALWEDRKTVRAHFGENSREISPPELLANTTVTIKTDFYKRLYR